MTEPPDSSERLHDLPLGAWSRAHALGIAVATSVAVWQRAAWPVAALALPSLSGLLWLGRRAFTPRGRFGAANTVTTGRAILVCALSAPVDALSAVATVAVVCAVLTLDLLDGWLARRRGDASSFGAQFDMETDALLVLMVSLRLWLGVGLGAWALCPGLLRYAYVLWLWCWPGSGREAPRSRFGRFAFAGLMLGLCAGLALPAPWSALAVAAGTLLVAGSFARSIYFSRLPS